MIPAFALALASAGGLSAPHVVSPVPGVSDEGRVIVVGFDGTDYRTTAKMIAEGQLPNLARLAQEGTFAPLRSTNPAESAAGWAALNTGVNPVVNGVPSFVIRDFTGGGVGVQQGHLRIETVPMDGFEPGGFLGLVAGTDRTLLAGGAGIAVALVFFLLLAVLVRTNKVLAAALALLLGGLSSVAGWRARSWVPTEVPSVHRNEVQADAFWDHAGQAGVSSIVLDAALAFDRPHHENTRVLSGLGLPDIRSASNGEWFFYTSDDTVLARAAVDDGSGEKVKTPRGSNGTRSGRRFRFQRRNDGVYESLLFGPIDLQERSELLRESAEIEHAFETAKGFRETDALNERRREVDEKLKAFGVDGQGQPLQFAADRAKIDLDAHRVSLPIEVEVVDDVARITIAGRTQELREGSWSDWFRLPFEISPLVRASAITRIKLMSLEDPLEIYVNNLEIDPEAPPFWQPISQPASFAGDLASWIDSPYETLGWSCMTNQLKDVALDEATFLEDIEFTMSWRRRLMGAALARDDWRLLFGVYSTPDRVQHVLYKHYDPGHPQHDPEAAAREVTFFGETIPMSECIPAIYRQVDARVGEVLDQLGPNDTLLLCADHGFNSFRYQMDVNSWLAEQGFLAIDPEASHRDGSGTGYIDWSRTRAYALGLGMVRLNLKGREPQGIVEKEDAAAILDEIAAAFLELRDDAGSPIGFDAKLVWDLYPADWASPDYELADLMLGFGVNYRGSWRTVTGGAYLQDGGDGPPQPGPLTRNNTNPWSGDHASNAPDLVTGIFFSNRPVAVPATGVSVMHIAPTVLDRLGVAVPEILEKAPLGTAD